MTLILEGVVGSQAYGLATPDSDEDRLGVWIEPTVNLVGLHVPVTTRVKHDPDVTHHEIGKFLQLCLACNPTVLELLYLNIYTVQRCDGFVLTGARDMFLSNRVRQTYGGYARQQFEKLQRRGDFGSDLKKRYAKHARHMMRLLHQGTQLLTTGTLTVRLEDPEYYHWVGTLPPEKLVHQWETADAAFQRAESVLPDEPDTARINDFLVRVRRRHFDHD